MWVLILFRDALFGEKTKDAFIDIKLEQDQIFKEITASTELFEVAWRVIFIDNALLRGDRVPSTAVYSVLLQIPESDALFKINPILREPYFMAYSWTTFKKELKSGYKYIQIGCYDNDIFQLTSTPILPRINGTGYDFFAAKSENIIGIKFSNNMRIKAVISKPLQSYPRELFFTELPDRWRVGDCYADSYLKEIIELR